MSVTEILHQIEALPPKDRWQVLEHTRHWLEAEIPESFTQGMAEIARGDVIELDEALKSLDTPEWTVENMQVSSPKGAKQDSPGQRPGKKFTRNRALKGRSKS